MWYDIICNKGLVITMEIIKITPQGLCKGVINAINIINKTLEDKTIPRPIYMLGGLVHNDHIINAFKEQGIIVLDDKNKTRLELLDEIPNGQGTVIITAHGVGDKVIEKVKEKGLFIVNATCKDVTKTHNLIKHALQEGKKVLYYGKNNHPETEGTLLISNEIILIEDNFNLEDLPEITTPVILTNQTTMSYLDCYRIYQKLLTKYPQLELLEEVCSATRLRQEAVIRQAGQAQLCLVVGDKKSNNTQKLVEMVLKYTNSECIKIQSVEDLNDIDLDKYSSISITAGASTPKAIVNEIIETLRVYPKIKKPFKTKLKGLDYLQYR